MSTANQKDRGRAQLLTPLHYLPRFFRHSFSGREQQGFCCKGKALISFGPGKLIPSGVVIFWKVASIIIVWGKFYTNSFVFAIL